jgi:hypothetical protein
MSATYCLDAIGVWHAVAWLDDFGHRVRGKCRHDFAFTSPPVSRRPHKDRYCAGCLGAEQKEKASQANAAAST